MASYEGGLDSQLVSGLESLTSKAKQLRLKGESLAPLVDELYRQFPPVDPSLAPTFKLEIECFKARDYVWSQISLGDEAELYEGRIKKLKKERLRKLPDLQMKVIGGILGKIRMWNLRDSMAINRAMALLCTDSVLGPSIQCWYLGLLKQALEVSRKIQCRLLSYELLAF